jgi:two-component system CheB/CheR fusion protein
VYAKIARDLTAAELRDRTREATQLVERVERDRLREASVMKDQFLAVISHELKNPLATIQMSTELISRLPSFGSEPRAVRATEAIRYAVSSQVHIINDLLELSQVDMGKVVLAPRPLHLPELIRKIGDALAPDLDKKRLTLTLELDAGIIVVADLVRVEQIVWNLLTNAIEFTPERGQIRASLAIDGTIAKFSVADSGIGVEPRLLGGLFEMFMQVESGPSRKETGLGIGLALVKQPATLHGGRVDATSEGLGRGAQFHVWLPLGTATADAPAPHVSERPGRMIGLRVLLVDDEPLLLSTFKDLLELEGAAVVSVDSALLALERARAQTFDVIVSDLAMPEHDGYWLAAQLRGSPDTQALPLIAVSGMARAADREKALNSGFDGHVGKPLELPELHTEIAQAIARRNTTSSATVHHLAKAQMGVAPMRTTGLRQQSEIRTACVVYATIFSMLIRVVLGGGSCSSNRC